MGSNCEEAKTLAARGLRVFPTMPGTKRPAKDFKWKDRASRDPATIERWFGPGGEYADHGVGVAAGSGFLIVDADVKDGQPGLQSLKLMGMMGADLDFRVSTPSGGEHAYFRVTDGQPVPNAVKTLADFPGIDIRGDGGYVVGPGTPGYEIISSLPTPEVPSWLLSAVRARRQAAPVDADPDVPLDNEASIQRAISWLNESAKPAVEGERNIRAFEAVCMVRDFGVSGDTALLIVDKHWNHNPAKVESPLDLEEIEMVVDSAYKGNASNRYAGSKSALAEFEAVEVIDRRSNNPFANPKGKQLAAPALHLMNPAALVGLPPPREWLVNGWAPQRKVTLLSGNGGTGKTLIAQQLAASRAVAARWLGRSVTPGPTLCVFTEDDEDELWRRQDDINASLGVERKQLGQVRWLAADRIPPSGWMMMSFDRENPEGRFHPFMQQLDDAMSEHRFKLLILDAAANVFGGDEINRNQVTTFVNRALNKLCTKHDASVILLAHPSVAGMAEGSGRSGSTGWANACRARLYLTRLPKKLDATGDLRHLSTTKANYGKEGEAVTMRWSRGQFDEVVGGPDVITTANSQVYAVLQQVEAAGLRPTLSPTGPSSVASLVRNHPDGSHLDKATVDAAVRRLLDTGMLAERPYTGANRIEAKHNMIYVTGTGADAENDDGFGD